MKEPCYICGEIGKNPLKIKKTFTAHTSCKNINSRTLCDKCFSCIEGKYKQCWYFNPTKNAWSKLWGRNWSWLVGATPGVSYPKFKPEKKEGLLVVHVLPTRQLIRGWLINPPPPPFTIAIATSGQKHTYPFSVAATDRDLFPVFFEDTLIEIDRKELIFLIDKIEALMKLGISKTDIGSGDMNLFTLNKNKSSLREVIKLDLELMPFKEGQLFKVALFSAQNSDSTVELNPDHATE